MKKFAGIPFVFTILFIIESTLIVSSFADAEEECKSTTEKTMEKRLRKYLFCEYESPYKPSLGVNGTNVTIEIAPTKLDFNEETGNLELFGWFVTNWVDPHLNWDPTSYENITSLPIKSYRIWKPRIVGFSAGNEAARLYGPPGEACLVLFHGTVFCGPQVAHKIKCQTDFSQWPFDRQNCSLVLSTWLHSDQHIRFVERYQTVHMYMHQSNQEWTLITSRAVIDQRQSIFSNSPNSTSPRLTIDFILDREHNQLSGRYITPVIIMMIMTLTTLWLDPKSTERLALGCVNLIIHLFCMQDLHWVLPHNGSAVPNLLIFYVNSLALATIALVLTFVLKSLQRSKIEPPTWISWSTAAILRSKVGQILLLMLDPKVAATIEPDAEDSGDLMSSKSKTNAWGYVTIMCGWISFIVFLMTYFIMYAMLVPNASMRPPISSLGYKNPYIRT